MKIILMGEPMGLFMANETGPLSEVSSFTASIAGAEYNVAVGLARLGHTPAYCTRLGFDPLGERILNGMRKNGIATDLVMQTETAQTGFMMKGFTQQGDPDIAYYRKGSAASQLTTHDIDGLDLSGCERLHVTGIFPAVSDSALAATKRLMRRAEALELPISFDPNLRPQLWPSEKQMIATLNSLAQGVETVLPGIGEGKLLTGRDTPENRKRRGILLREGWQVRVFSGFPREGEDGYRGRRGRLCSRCHQRPGGRGVPGGGHLPRERHWSHPDHPPQRLKEEYHGLERAADPCGSHSLEARGSLGGHPPDCG